MKGLKYHLRNVTYATSLKLLRPAFQEEMHLKERVNGRMTDRLWYEMNIVFFKEKAGIL